MALVLADRVKETTTTTGTGTYTLAGAVTGFESFSVIGNANTTYYCCTDGTDFEVGIGTYTASGTTLARTTILQSSNSDAAVNWTSGTRDIFITQPAEKAVFLDASGNIIAANGSALTALNASNLASGTVANARLDTELQALAGLTSAADKGIQFTGSGTAATYDLTAAGKALLDDADASAQRTTLGLAIGSDVQAYDAELAALAGLTSAADKGIQFTGSGTAATYDLTAAGKALLDDADASAQRTTLGLGTAAVLDTGISNTNVPKFTSGVADNDFLRVDGTAIEGRSASQVLDDIGAMPISQTINAQTGTTFVPALSDAAQLVTLNNASAISVAFPPNSSVAYAIGTRIDFIQIGAGQVTFAGGTGVTVNATPTLKMRAQHSAASCIKIGTDTWQLVGDLAES